MRFNFISTAGDGLGIALKVQKEGNDVRLWIDEHDAQAIGDGLVPKVGDLWELTHDANPTEDIFVFDTSGNGVLADGLAKYGFPTIGGSVLADRLEKDRKFARGVMESSGIGTPSSVTFKDFDSAIEFANTVSEKLVYKPSKRLGEESPSLVTYDSSDLLELLNNLKNRVQTSEIEFDLQSFEEGLEISTEGWFDGNGWLPLFNHTFERKQLMPGNIGPSGGCTGNVVWACDGECPVCDAGIKKLTRFLRNKRYRGPIDINAIINDGGFFGLEFTPRFGYDAFPTLTYKLLDMEVGQFLADLALGRYIASDAILADRFAGAVKITIPPWPTEKFHAEPDVPIRGINAEDMDSVYWYNVKKGPASAGAWGLIGLTLGVGSTIGHAFRMPYKIAEAMRLQDKQYRIDLVEEFKSDFSELEGLTNGVQRSVG
jgi:phosphoribosylamine-glycine ligase